MGHVETEGAAGGARREAGGREPCAYSLVFIERRLRNISRWARCWPAVRMDNGHRGTASAAIGYLPSPSGAVSAVNAAARISSCSIIVLREPRRPGAKILASCIEGMTVEWVAFEVKID